MQGADLDLLVDAAREAGEIALGFWRDAPRTWEKPRDAGPVSEADLAVDEMLHDRLRVARPDYGWLSEETEDDGLRLDRERVFIVDPIDGTRAFVDGEKTWSHALAVVEHGRAVAGVVYLPVLDKLYVAAAGRGAFLDGAPIHPSSREGVVGARVLASRPVLEPRHWRHGQPAEIERHFRPSLAYRLALVAEGRFDAMLTLRDTWEWDAAAGSLIASEAGALVTDRLGNPPRFNNPRPLVPGLVAAGPAMHRDLRDRLAA